MIDTKELMIGNLVECKSIMDGNEISLPVQIELISKNSVDVTLGGEAWNYVDYELTGIPIMEFLLEKYGFYRCSDNIWKLGNTELYKNIDGDDFDLSLDGNHIDGIKFLHELQNAYFMLTRKRLEINLCSNQIEKENIITKTVNERAKEYAPDVAAGHDYEEVHNDSDIVEYERTAFIAGAESEHRELTKWNSPDNPPDNAREVLIKVVMGYSVARYRDESSLEKGWYVEGNLYTESLVVGWREIHE